MMMKTVITDALMGVLDDAAINNPIASAAHETLMAVSKKLGSTKGLDPNNANNINSLMNRPEKSAGSVLIADPPVNNQHEQDRKWRHIHNFNQRPRKEVRPSGIRSACFFSQEHISFLRKR
jgi:hypothetical protein